MHHVPAAGTVPRADGDLDLHALLEERLLVEDHGAGLLVGCRGVAVELGDGGRCGVGLPGIRGRSSGVDVLLRERDVLLRERGFVALAGELGEQVGVADRQLVGDREVADDSRHIGLDGRRHVVTVSDGGVGGVGLGDEIAAPRQVVLQLLVS